MMERLQTAAGAVVLCLGVVLCSATSPMCEDLRPDCSYYKKQNQCNDPSTKLVCPKTCSACTDEESDDTGTTTAVCRDLRKDCSYFKSRNQCNDPRIKPLCPKTCELCTDEKLDDKVTTTADSRSGQTASGTGEVQPTPVDPQVVCLMAPPSGDCGASETRWHYHSLEGRCLTFKSGGCRGNDNNFESEEACNRYCRAEDICQQPNGAERCQQSETMYYYDSVTNECREFEGCGFSLNNFVSLEACQKKCGPEPSAGKTREACNLPRLDGIACTNRFASRYTYYYYDNNSGRCQEFTYTGCGGNENRFNTEKECTTFCSWDDTTTRTSVRAWGEWSQWSQWTECSATCGSGTRTKSRTCRPPGGACQGNDTTTAPCNLPACCVPRNGEWITWGVWSQCSRSCGGGSRTRQGTCSGQNECGRRCEGNGTQTENCDPQVCPKWGDWSQWTECSATCGRGTRTKSRTCRPPGGTCQGDDTTTVSCNLPACCVPRDGRWTTWGEWSQCSRSCGGGRRTRERTCSGRNECGRSCEGNGTQTENCNPQACPNAPPAMPTFTVTYPKAGNNLTVSVSGVGVWFQCESSSWNRQFLEIFKVTSSGPQQKKTASDVTFTTYTIQKPDCEDAGVYYCSARNAFGQTNSTSVQLNVLCPPRQVSNNTKRVEVTEGSDGLFKFEVIAYPVPTIDSFVYFKKDALTSSNQEPVRSGLLSGGCERHAVDLHLAICTVHVTDAAVNDNGIYYFKVRNQHGNINVTFELHVTDRDSSDPDSSPSSSVPYIGLALGALVLAFIAASVVFVIRRRKGATTKSTEKKRNIYDAPAVGVLNGDEPTYCNVTTDRVREPVVAHNVTSASALSENVYVNYDKSTSPKHDEDLGASKSPDENTQNDLYAVVEKNKKAENSEKAPKPAVMPKPKRTGSAARKPQENGGDGLSVGASTAQGGGPENAGHNHNDVGPSDLQKATLSEEGLFYTELDFSQYRSEMQRPLPQHEETNYAAVDFLKPAELKS